MPALQARRCICQFGVWPSGLRSANVVRDKSRAGAEGASSISQPSAAVPACGCRRAEDRLCPACGCRKDALRSTWPGPIIGCLPYNEVGCCSYTTDGDFPTASASSAWIAWHHSQTILSRTLEVALPEPAFCSYPPHCGTQKRLTDPTFSSPYDSSRESHSEEFRRNLACTLRICLGLTTQARSSQPLICLRGFAALAEDLPEDAPRTYVPAPIPPKKWSPNKKV